MNQKTNKDKVYTLRVDEPLREALRSIPSSLVRLELRKIVDKFAVMERSKAAFLNELGDIEKDEIGQRILKGLIGL